MWKALRYSHPDLFVRAVRVKGDSNSQPVSLACIYQALYIVHHNGI
jgi:hypothetical protein